MIDIELRSRVCTGSTLEVNFCEISSVYQIIKEITPPGMSSGNNREDP